MRVRSAISQEGFTLLEMVVGLVLLGIVSVAITTLNGNLFLGSTQMQDVNQKTAFLQTCMDELIGIRKMQGFSGISSSNSPCAKGISLSVSTSCPSSLATGLPDLPTGQACKQVQISTTGMSQPVMLLFLD